jgi:signal transduction histidine kinase/CheY-like chemotaxis protein
MHKKSIYLTENRENLIKRFFKISGAETQTEDGYIDFEKQFILPLSFAGMLISFIGLFVNILVGFKTILYVIPVVWFFIYAMVFLFVKYKGKYLYLMKWILFFITLLVINILWLYNFGSEGPAPYLFLLLYSFMIFMWKDRDLLFVSLIVFLNIVVLFLLDYYEEGLTGNYVSQKAKIIDVYTALFYYGIVMFTLMKVAKRSYERAYFNAKKADMLKSSFLANLSHEIKTPLNTIIGFSELLASDNNSLEQKKKYERILYESNEILLRLVKDILDISHIESNQLVLNRSEVNVVEVIDSLEQVSKVMLKEKNKTGIIFVKDIPKEKIFVNTDIVRLRQIFTNLIDNAIKYTSQGVITIGLSVKDDYLLFYVKDTGIGIEKRYLDKIFERYYKVNRSDNKFLTGAGIGLFLSKRLVELLGGKIWVDSEVEKGSTFFFTLPKKGFRVEEHVVVKKPEKLEKAKVINGNAKNNFSNNLKILIVDDDIGSVFLLKQMLSEIDAEIFQAFNGAGAIEMFNLHKDINLVLLDLKMPIMTGYDVIKELRKIKKDVFVVAQTAFAMEKDRSRVYEEGFDAFITKPINRNLLYDVIKGLGLIRD